MTDDIFRRAEVIRNELDRSKAELGAFRTATYWAMGGGTRGSIKIVPDNWKPDRAVWSKTLLDFLCREDVKEYIEKMMQENIKKLEEEYEGL